MKRLVAAAAFVAFATTAHADSVEYAYRVCKWIDSTGLVSSPCEVSGWSATVTATIDMNSGEARKLCGQMASLIGQKGLRFNDRDWKLQIKSPYSGGNTIAFCNLPN